MSTVDLSRHLGISEPTVRKKLAQLTREGLIRIRAAADPNVLGFRASAFIGIDVERAAIGKVAARLQGYSFVDSVAVTTGPYDLMVKACFANLQALHDFVLVELADVEGIKDTHSFLILQTYKSDALVGTAGDPIL